MVSAITHISSTRVALLTEGVDRNRITMWTSAPTTVALLTEGVDRNAVVRIGPPGPAPSPSSRRAWIEMLSASLTARDAVVALLTEGVDRNIPFAFAGPVIEGRPPRGGRG